MESVCSWWGVVDSASERPPAGAPAPKVEAAKPVAAVGRTASDELRKHWPFGSEPELVLYGDLAGFMKTELVSGIAPSLLALGKGAMSDVQRECVQSLIGAVRELAVGANEGGPLFLLRFDEAAVKPGPAACLQAVSVGQPIELAGATAAFARENDVAALKPGLLAFGTKKMVSEALAAKGRESGRPGSSCRRTRTSRGARAFPPRTCRLRARSPRRTISSASA